MRFVLACGLGPCLLIASLVQAQTSFHPAVVERDSGLALVSRSKELASEGTRLLSRQRAAVESLANSPGSVQLCEELRAIHVEIAQWHQDYRDVQARLVSAAEAAKARAEAAVMPRIKAERELVRRTEAAFSPWEETLDRTVPLPRTRRPSDLESFRILSPPPARAPRSQPVATSPALLR